MGGLTVMSLLFDSTKAAMSLMISSLDLPAPALDLGWMLRIVSSNSIR